MNNWLARPDWSNCGWQPGGISLMFIGIVLLIGAAVVIFLVVAKNRDQSGRPSLDGPADIARARYARGELTKSEFQEIIEEIKRSE